MENPKNRPKRPPQFAKKSVCPYNSDLLDVMKCDSLKNSTSLAILILFNITIVIFNKYLKSTEFLYMYNTYSGKSSKSVSKASNNCFQS